jgi:hypothetical protein
MYFQVIIHILILELMNQFQLKLNFFKQLFSRYLIDLLFAEVVDRIVSFNS